MKSIISLVFLISVFSYSQNIVSEEINHNNGEIELQGTLTYPENNKALPLLIFIQGSGNVDRNGNQAGTPIQIGYIKDLRDSLNQKDIAFYSYDKRTANTTNLSKLQNTSFEDLVADAKLAIKQFEEDKRFSSVHLIGHSQGSLVGMMAIEEGVASFISLAGTGSTIDKKIVEQISAQSADFGAKAKEHFRELMETDTILTVDPMLIQIFAPQNQKFLKAYALIDPSEEIKKVKVPVLIINGDADIQVSLQDAETLHKALEGSELLIIPKMNHVLKEVNSLQENQQAYVQKAFSLSVPLLETIQQFIMQHH